MAKAIEDVSESRIINYEFVLDGNGSNHLMTFNAEGKAIFGVPLPSQTDFQGQLLDIGATPNRLPLAEVQNSQQIIRCVSELDVPASVIIVGDSDVCCDCCEIM